MATVNSMNTPGERVAIVAGLRTPFARQLRASEEEMVEDRITTARLRNSRIWRSAASMS